jgi:HAD superfamily hydrolase (TIGR01549 family)
MNTHPSRLIVFDLYGTLIKFGTSHHPYRKILRWEYEQGRKPVNTDARFLMTRNEGVESVLGLMGINAPDNLLQTFHREIEDELNSLTLFDDVVPTLQQLVEAEVGLAICSNLAKPYGAIIDRLLPDFHFTRILSYDVGFIKPENGIYEAILNKTGHKKENVLFVGDTYVADFEGPSRFGFQALHLCRDKVSSDYCIQSLREILNRL